MLKIIELLLDLIFPPRTTELAVRNATSVELTSFFQPDKYQSVCFLASYHEPLLEALIKENKYHQNQTAAKLLATLLEKWIASQPARPLVLVPIPQSKERRREREHNQVESVLKQLVLPSGITINSQLLQKSRHTPTQTSLSRSERLENMRESFSLVPETDTAGVSGATVVIVDDVLTTGATMEAARASLAPHLPPSTTLILLALVH